MATVLLVDDEHGIRVTVGAFLKKAGHCVYAADGVHEAMELFDHTLTDVVVTDVRLGDGSGIEILQAIRQRGANTPVIVMSGDADVDSVAASMRARAFAYIEKPVSPETIVKAVAQACGRLGATAGANPTPVPRPSPVPARAPGASVVGVDPSASETQATGGADAGRGERLAMLGTLAGGIGHEVNNPLNGILNYAQLLLDQLPAGGPQAGLAAEILREGERIAGVVRGLIRLAQPDAAAGIAIGVDSLIGRALELCRISLEADGTTVNLRLDPGLPPVWCRPHELQLVLLNLLSNAARALNERYSGRAPEKTIDVMAARVDAGGSARVRVTVADRGTGMDPAVADRLFTPFFTTGSRTERSGMGLALCYSIVRAHGGSIAVNSTPGEGTRVCIELPVGGSL